MSNDLCAKIDIIFFKGTLIDVPTENIQESFSKKDDYKLFLEALNSTLKQEPAFFLLSDKLIKKAEDTLYEHRFAYKDEEIINLINECIIGFNKLKNIDNQTKIDSIKVYVQEQREKRETYIPDREQLIFMISHDTLLLESMLSGKRLNWQAGYFIGSTNYLVKTIPEFYAKSEGLIQQTINNLKQITDDKTNPNFFVKSYAQKSIKNIQKIKTKEE